MIISYLGLSKGYKEKQNRAVIWKDYASFFFQKAELQ